MWNSAKSYRLVDEAIAQGQLWRAKEILKGNIGTQPFNPVLYERCGQVLLLTGDFPEAGKYLFLSGVRHPEYLAAIEEYLRRYRRQGPHNLYRSFPIRARLENVADYPLAVQEELRAQGFPELIGSTKPQGAPQPRGADWVGYVGIAVFFFCVVCAAVGFVTIMRTVSQWVR